MGESTEAALRRLSVLVGEWTTRSTHPAVPGTVVHGQATFEWLEDQRFLIWSERADHPDFPAQSIIGDKDGLQAHSLDSRVVYRVVDTRISDKAWEYLMPRDQPSDTGFAEGTPGFSGRLVGTFEDAGNTIVGRSWSLHRLSVSGRPRRAEQWSGITGAVSDGERRTRSGDGHRTPAAGSSLPRPSTLAH